MWKFKVYFKEKLVLNFFNCQHFPIDSLKCHLGITAAVSIRKKWLAKNRETCKKRVQQQSVNNSIVNLN